MSGENYNKEEFCYLVGAPITHPNERQNVLIGGFTSLR